jgi:hypothetical protein
MYNTDTEMIFPSRLVPTLRDLRGESWQELVDRIAGLEAVDAGRLAFVLLMIRLGGCTTCQADSFRALRGCTHCAGLTIKRFRGSDGDLLEQFQAALQEVERYLGKPVD